MTEKKCDMRYKIGEVLRFDLTATSSRADDLIVMTSARWALKRISGDGIVASGNAEISGSSASFTVPFEHSGYYDLECYAEVPPETLAAVVRLEVKP